MCNSEIGKHDNQHLNGYPYLDEQQNSIPAHILSQPVQETGVGNSTSLMTTWRVIPPESPRLTAIRCATWSTRSEPQAGGKSFTDQVNDGEPCSARLAVTERYAHLAPEHKQAAVALLDGGG